MTSGQKKTTRRQQLIDAARRLFIEKGFAATTIEEITAQCSVTRGVFYSYFNSKSELYGLAINTVSSDREPKPSLLSDWETSMLSHLVDWSQAASKSANSTYPYMPLRFFANEDYSTQTRHSYTVALKRSIQELLDRLNTDFYRGESALLSITAMIVGAEVVAKKLDDPYWVHKLRWSCERSAAAIGKEPAIDEPLHDYFWEALPA
jgi:AcrR family transcriptional regulator